MSLTEEVKKVIDEVENNKCVRNVDLLRLYSFGIPARSELKKSHYVWEDFCDLLREKYQVK